MSFKFKKIDLEDRANRLFYKIIRTPSSIREDSKNRIGIAVLCREIGTDNIVYFTVGVPSDTAKFLVSEKATRSEIRGEYSSRNSKDKAQLQFAGAITVEIEGRRFQASCSGLKEAEDEFISIDLLSISLNLKKEEIIKQLRNKKALFENFWLPELNYLQMIK